MGATHPTPAENTDPLSARLEGLVPDAIGPDIDQRMKNLLADHIDMGARPKREAGNGDAYAATLPLNRVGTDDKGKTILPKDDKPKAAKKK